MSDPPRPPEVLGEEPEHPEFPGHTAAFGRIMRTSHEGQQSVSALRSYVDDLMRLRDDELVLLGQVRAYAHVMVWPEALAAEIARRSAAALTAFKQESATASSRLQTLTRWLIGFTVAVVVLTFVVAVLTFVVAVLTGIVAWHDLTR